MPWHDGLSGQHYDIAASAASRIDVLAGPGTGKTKFGLIPRVARLLEEGTPGSRILLLTFTRTAARDLQEKIADRAMAGADAVLATTLHAYCFSILHRESVLSITHREPRILLNHEVDRLLYDLRGEYGGIRQRRSMLKSFEAGWLRGIEQHPGSGELEVDRAFEREVLAWLRHHHAMLIGEVVPLAFNFLVNNPVNEEANRFDHVLVDEYQDLNYLEQKLVQELVRRDGANLCVIGDDDQSIYGFRHANPDGIRSVHADEHFEHHEIYECGRCPEPILSSVNHLMRQAAGREKGDLHPRDPQRRADFRIVQWSNLDAEVEGIVTAIVTDLSTGRFTEGETLVLTQRRAIGTRITRRLLELNVPAVSFYNQEVLDNESARESLALLQLAVGEDRAALRVILGLGSGDGRRTAYRRLVDYAAKTGKSEMQILDEMEAGTRHNINIRALSSRYHAARAEIAALDLEDIDSVVKKLFRSKLEETDDLRRVADECSLLATDAADLLDRMIIRISQEDVPADPNFVRVMSLHKSKGLTSRSVYVVGALHGILPMIDSGNTEEEQAAAYDEQRRLFYVAVTRATDQLVISSSRALPLGDAAKFGVTTGTLAGNVVRTIASPYISELGPTAPTPITGSSWIETLRANAQRQPLILE
jgi:superfamily I DNA/RNA helicase